MDLQEPSSHAYVELAALKMFTNLFDVNDEHVEKQQLHISVDFSQRRKYI